MQTVYYIGLDVHKDTIQMAVLSASQQEPVAEKTLSSDYAKLGKAILPYKEDGNIVQVAYEAGCLGYALYRFLTKLKVDCRVIPPNKVFRGGNDRQIKTDKRDAILIAKMLKRNEGESINIPTPQDESARDLLRCRSDLKDDLKRAKQRLLNFLLRHGFRYESERYWTGKHRKWMTTLTFDMPLDKTTFDEYMNYIESTEERIKRIDTEIETVAESEPYAEKVKKLRAFKGIDYIIALSLLSEIGDFRRFSNAGAFMSYLGIVPGEQSSGKKRRQGAITKTGNSLLRKLLTESAWHYVPPVRASKRLAARRVGTSETVISYADKAISRLHGKFTRLTVKGKPRNVAVTAITRELAGFVWGVMTMNA